MGLAARLGQSGRVRVERSRFKGGGLHGGCRTPGYCRSELPVVSPAFYNVNFTTFYILHVKCKRNRRFYCKITNPAYTQIIYTEPRRTLAAEASARSRSAASAASPPRSVSRASHSSQVREDMKLVAVATFSGAAGAGTVGAW